ncbi:DNA adenine methylase [Victivallis vadensis]|uniref:DNA adenine methylase n=1 Tax=Victivallis vadensis TaxID=172901 RepID=UPI0023F26285|nr:Dam family site-specific DNA-(adenine-N6)-methyltransferase [Victivallis vadensis]
MALPFLKWAGGKRWFVDRYENFLPKSYNRFIEPFLGSGAVFFALEPEHGIIGDINSQLISTYLAVRDNWRIVLHYLEIHHVNHSKDYYYKVRANIPRSRYAKAARFIYLNRTCWNGLYRVNKAGNFNVPVGTKTNVILRTDNFEYIACLLRNIEIINDDFEAIIDRAEENDFIFADPPYTIKHNNNGFVKYNEEMFSWRDQVRLKDAIVRATERGVQVLVTNAYHPSVVELYSNFTPQVVSRASVIAADSSNRGVYEEIIITNNSLLRRDYV